jgi:glycosyltransferase involved in cell wall biosynthesis
MNVEILYPAWNRREFTEESLRALADNTDWGRVSRVVFYDDGSEDGTRQTVETFRHSLPVPSVLRDTRYGSCIAVMNDYLQSAREVDLFAKIDSDTMVPPGWLDVCLQTMAGSPELSLLGIEALATGRDGNLGWEPTDEIGGIGLMRQKVFQGQTLPHQGIYAGFNFWQQAHPEVLKGWVSPPLHVFLLDRLPMDPWRTISDRYIGRGWQRPWKNYTQQDSWLWDWWLP